MKKALIIIHSILLSGIAFNAPVYTHNHIDPEKPHIVFDLGEILFTPDKSEAFRMLGRKAVAHYLLRHWHSPRAEKDTLFTLLHGSAQPNNNGLIPLMDGGTIPMPALLQAWMCGTMTNRDIFARAEAIINNATLSRAQRHIMIGILTIMMMPDKLTLSLKTCRGGLKILKRCVQAGYNVYILSNFDKEAIVHMRQRFPEVFDLVPLKNQIISGEVGTMKPYPTMYQYLADRTGIPLERFIFIDDHAENIQGALAAGMTPQHVIHCPDKNFKGVRERLRALNALPKRRHLRRHRRAHQAGAAA